MELVGVVERERRGVIYLDFVLHDSSGRFPIRFGYPSPRYNLPEFEGRYVRVIGRVACTNQRFVRSNQVYVIETAVSFHLIHVAHTPRFRIRDDNDRASAGGRSYPSVG